MSLLVRKEGSVLPAFTLDRLALGGLICEVSLGLGLVIGLHQVVHGLKIRPMFTAVLLALALTRILGKVEVRGIWKAAILLSAGGGFTFMKAAELWPEVVTITRKLAVFMLVRINPDQLGEAVSLTETAEQAWIKISDFTDILEVWITQLTAGVPIQIEPVTQLIWGLAGFGLIAWAGWHLHIRSRPYLAVAPAIAVMLVSVAVTDNGHAFFGLLLAVSLLIVVVFSHARRERQWTKAGHGYSAEIRVDLILMALGVGVVFFFFTAAAPNLSIKKAIDRYREKRTAREETTDLSPSVGLYDQYPEDSPGNSGGLPSSHLLTGAPELLDTVMFQVWVEEEDETQTRGYWRTHVYEEYTGRGWLGGMVLPRRLEAGQRIPGTPAGPRTRLTIRAEGIHTRKQMVYANQIVWVSQPATFFMRESPERTADLSSVTVSAQVYQVETARPSATLTELRLSGDAYPEWVADRYLQLPDGIPQRVFDLASEVTADQPDPYSLAKAIENYLRQFPYTLDISAPPADQDVADHFLFDLQQGYCDYYATTMVVLARSAGLPSRVVSGYRGGEFDQAAGAFQVAEDNAHSWVEVYFNGIGWIEFEPTPAYPLIALEDGSADRDDLEGAEPGGQLSLSPLDSRPVVVWGAGLAFLAGAVLFGWDRLKFRRASARELLVMARDRIHQIAHELGLDQPRSATLNELHLNLTVRLIARFPRWLHHRTLPPLERLLISLTDTAYRGKPPEAISRRGVTTSLLRARRVSLLIRFSNLVER